jgi:hypothetical protein
MSYRVIAARWANPQHTAVSCQTEGFGDVFVPLNRGGEQRAALQEFLDTGGTVAAFVPEVPPAPPRNLAAEFDAMKAALIRKSVVSRDEAEGKA